MSDASSLTPTTKIQFLAGVGPQRAERLAKLGIYTLRDLLFFFPRDYEHPAAEVAIDRLKDGQAASVTGVITDAELSARSSGKSIFGAVVTNETGSVRIVFFNQPFRADTLTFERRVMISGVPTQKGLRMEFVHPKVKILREDEAAGAGEILPVYPLTDGFKQYDIRRYTREVLEQLARETTEVMPEDLRRAVVRRLRDASIDPGGIDHDGPLPPIDRALWQIHFPTDDRSLIAARTRFVSQELLVMQLALAMRRRSLTTDLNAPVIDASPETHAAILDRFGFTLTDDQRQVVQEIRHDLRRQFPMNRLLQGDVGSGKTAVAFYAMMLAHASSHQSVLMAPTEVLARQHYENLRHIHADNSDHIGLLSGSLGTAQRRDVLQRVADGRVTMLVGTQALLYDVKFQSLGVCVIDEQHKFGVRQRTALRGDDMDPHCLVMSATPIPRSIGMTLFGDVDMSTIRQKPPGRTEVHTYLAQDEWTQRWWQFVRQRLDEGRQVYVVAPRVGPATASAPSDPSNNDANADGCEDVASVETIYAQLRDDVLADFRVGLLHGRMKPDEKNATMEAFADGAIQVLVSTTVIEVGVDVPNATVMTILGANRFGLAQLHQLRGRINRGVHPGHVAVFTDGDVPPDEVERLKIFESTDDGFELAEADFRMRGPGDMLGKQQSGLPPLRVADLARDREILAVVRELAQDMIDGDPEMNDEALSDLRRQVLRRYGDRMELADGA
ncbi:ATP-dependent DNA helicase RecG [Crateriforma conspicua]|uniref:Probable DNA 3'-5' helicase RecG n=1 Tax=Crateriforma conspicua TaxID=2527996 RepID=A0A5C5Y801_9PLAN|nr:ATP-dependent DNA helicase RecG [Crateriforma conspicua]TWT71797.1 ATP-dependent DNA helicase RecG [Crateriforma conspicua]